MSRWHATVSVLRADRPSRTVVREDIVRCMTMRERSVCKQKNLVRWLHFSAALVLVSTAVATARLDGQGPGPATRQGATRVDYRRDVQPILNATCVGCHNGPTAPAELQLATPEGLLRGGTSGQA